ncbi:hypothetical protein [Grimontia hollisae]|uniref:hypothetical protein n=1 Tax=Grimontia hollisae TaxID=673 RepID=UPI00058D88A3|nr:hypothetical protein [Grimontia hollisae]
MPFDVRLFAFVFASGLGGFDALALTFSSCFVVFSGHGGHQLYQHVVNGIASVIPWNGASARVRLKDGYRVTTKASYRPRVGWVVEGELSREQVSGVGDKCYRGYRIFANLKKILEFKKAAMLPCATISNKEFSGHTRRNVEEVVAAP